MTTHKRILLGGLGAVIPIVVNFAIVDFATIMVSLTIVVVVGYLIRFVVLFFLGALWGYIHSSESDPKKIVQLGMVAPALITGILNASNVAVPASTTEANLLIAPAYAETTQPTPPSRPEESIIQQFIRGLTGSTKGK